MRDAREFRHKKEEEKRREDRRRLNEQNKATRLSFACVSIKANVCCIYILFVVVIVLYIFIIFKLKLISCVLVREKQTKEAANCAKRLQLAALMRQIRAKINIASALF